MKSDKAFGSDALYMAGSACLVAMLLIAGTHPRVVTSAGFEPAAPANSAIGRDLISQYMPASPERALHMSVADAGGDTYTDFRSTTTSSQEIRAADRSLEMAGPVTGNGPVWLSESQWHHVATSLGPQCSLSYSPEESLQVNQEFWAAFNVKISHDVSK